MFKRKLRRSRVWSKDNRLIDFEKAREKRKQNRQVLVKSQQTVEPEKPSKRKKIKFNRKRNFYSIMTMIVIVVICVSVFNVMSVNSQLAEVIAERDILENEKERLLYELQNVDSEEYIEQRARTMLKMIKPGEIYYVVPKEPE